MPACSICNKYVDHWIGNEFGQIFCSEECYRQTLPICDNCGSRMKKWIIHENGSKYCSDYCSDQNKPRCSVCNCSMNQWIIANGRIYCSQDCLHRSYQNTIEPFEKLTDGNDGTKSTTFLTQRRREFQILNLRFKISKT